MKESEAKETLERLYIDSTNEAYPFTEQFGEAVNVAIQALEKQMKKENADGCAGCAFEVVEEWEMPCTKCSRNCKDYYRAKEGSDKLPTAKTYLDALTEFRESLRKAGGIKEGTEIQNNAFSECREKLKNIYTGGYSKALFNFYKRLSECSEYARPVGWSTSQEIVQFQNVKQIYEQLKAGDSYEPDIE